MINFNRAHRFLAILIKGFVEDVHKTRLGLTIVTALVWQSNGHIIYTNQVDDGAGVQLKFQLPASHRKRT